MALTGGVGRAREVTDLFEFAAVTTNPPAGIPEDVARLFEALALEVIGAGFERYSSDAILHQIRWKEHIERGNRNFTCNNNWTASLARWFMARHPEHRGFFETRETKLPNARAAD